MEQDRIVNSRLFRQAAFPFFVRQWPHYERRKDPTASARSGNAFLRLRECQKRIWVVASRRCDPNRNISGITRLRFFPFYAGQNADASVILSLPLSLISVFVLLLLRLVPLLRYRCAVDCDLQCNARTTLFSFRCITSRSITFSAGPNAAR